MVETIPFGIADELGDDEALVLYLDEVLASGDPAYFAHALGKVAKARTRHSKVTVKHQLPKNITDC